MGAALCNPGDSDKARVVETVPQMGHDSETSPDSEAEEKMVMWRSRLQSEAPASPELGETFEGATTSTAATAATAESIEDEHPKPVLMKKKSILKRSGTDESTSKDSSTSKRQLKIGKSFEQTIPWKTASERELRISCGNQDVKRTGTYATLGLGYLINATMYEAELAKRSKSKEDSAVWPAEASTPPFSSCYLIEKEIASGGFATVYECSSKAVGGSRFAVKQVLKSSLSEAKACDLFKVEATFLKDLDHPNLAWRIQAFHSPDCLYLVMNMCSGRSLFERLCNCGTLSRSKACRIGWQVASGLECLHRHGIMHRDIKPENILFVSPGSSTQVKIIDFGIARLFEEQEKVKTQVGTLAYVPPEMFWGTYNQKIDVWALGCTLFLCVSGSLPMYSRFDEEFCRFIMEGRIAWYLVNWLDNDMLNLLKGCLQTDPEARCSSAEVAFMPWLVRAAKQSTGCCGSFMP